MKVACFYPWPAFEPCGAWSRFTSLWQYLVDQGASVTLCFIGPGKSCTMGPVSMRFLGDAGALHAVGQVSKKILSADAKSELKNFSVTELNFLLLYEKPLYLSRSGLSSEIEKEVRSHDAVTCEYPMLAPVLSEFCKREQKPLIVTAHDLLYELHGINPLAKEKLKRSEIDALKLADAVVACNTSEADTLGTLGVQCSVVPNSGDALAVDPESSEATKAWARASYLKSRLEDFVLFVGSAHGPNTEAATELKRLSKLFPKTLFVVAGACLPKSEEGNFKALGPVTERHLDLLYRGASAVVIPMIRGTGMSLKVFQALAYGKPILTSPVGARGYPIVNGVDAIIADIGVPFSTELKRILAERKLREALSAGARALSIQLDFRNQFGEYGRILTELVKRQSSLVTSRTSDRSLILVDNNLKDLVGHHFKYAESLRNEFAKTGGQMISLINKEAIDEVKSGTNGMAVFSDGLHEQSITNPYPPEWPQLRSRFEVLTASSKFSDELEAGLTAAARPGDVVFLPNATPVQILGLALLLQTRPIFRLMRFNLLMRYPLHTFAGNIVQRRASLDSSLVERYTLALSHLLSISQVSQIRLTTDSFELSQEYAEALGYHFDVLPIPHTSEAVEQVAVSSIPPKQQNLTRIVFLGDAREEKGFELLPYAVKAVLGNSPIATSVEFVLHAYISSPYHALMKVSIDELERVQNPRLTLLRKSLSSSEYNRLLQSADLVLIPYDGVIYKARTSGPLMEALCAGKPVIVPKGSWMAGVLNNKKAGEQFTSGSWQELARAIISAVQNRTELTKAAHALGGELAVSHCPKAFIESLLR